MPARLAVTGGIAGSGQRGATAFDVAARCTAAGSDLAVGCRLETAGAGEWALVSNRRGGGSADREGKRDTQAATTPAHH